MAGYDEISGYEEDCLRGFPGEMQDDPNVRFMLHEMFNENIGGDQRAGVYAALEEYVWSEYYLDFTDVMDWDAYREWYDSQ